MISDEQLTTSAKIAGSFLKQSTIEKSFSRRINERIQRLEAKKIKRKYDTISLSVIVSFVLVACVLIVLEITIDVFPDGTDLIYIPVILLIILFIIGSIFTAEYFIVKKEGSQNLESKLGTLQSIKSEMAQLQIEQTKIYNFVKDAFKSVEKIDSRFMLDGFVLRFYVKMVISEITEIEPDKLYHYLFLISIKKKLDVTKLLSAEQDQKKITEIIYKHLINYNKILTALINIESLPNYFSDCASRSKEFINNFQEIKLIRD
ncbi:MAG: hypothetical protein JXA54_08055 [Candidatus Heimdallarchaeota archaeon]|nr:hypothetical protein [Candidatus Heimdallarchaeota archaeon]